MRSASLGMRRGALVLAAGVLAALLGALGLAAVLDDAVYRALAAPRQPLSAPPAVVLGIDTREPWPWSNVRIAELVERLRNAGVRGVALDLPLQANPGDPAGDAQLARVLRDNRVVLGVTLAPQPGRPPRAQLPPIDFADAARLGHVLLPRDRDGRIRQHLPHQLGDDGVRWPSLPLALVKPGNGGGARDWNARDRWRINYAGDVATPHTLRASGFMAGHIDVSQLQGRWVLVGVTDPSQQVRVPGPHGSPALYPVEHEARALVAVLQGDTTRPLPLAAQALLALLLAGGALAAGLVRGGRDWRMPLALCAGLVAALALSAWLLTRQLWFAPGGVVAVLVIALLAWATHVLRREVRARRRLPGLASPARLATALDAVRTAGTPHVVLRVDTTGPDAGHDRGDTCLLAGLLRERARRPGDLAVHLGAGRFAMLLPGTPPAAANRLLEEIREQAVARGIPPPGARMHACEGDACTCAGALDATTDDIAQPSP
ncbi:MAG: CHASE2 domain-containing protein [Pseudoxanthomonas sp.]|nr:CHASE2 domain-containing protein [Pseudoxanthomonas sp.]